MSGRNDWSRPLIRPNVPKVDITTYTRENDLTFSFGEYVDYDDVVGLLLQSGCIDRKNYLNEIKMLKITKSLHNGQVFITCAQPNVCDEWVAKLNFMQGSGIRKCHSYSDKDVTVKFSFIHPSINIQKEIVENYLEKFHGPVKEWSALKENKWGIPNGAYVFIMREEDLAHRPILESILLGHVKVFVSYRTQVVTCHNCNEKGHIAVNCPKQEMFPTLVQAQAKGNLKVFLDGVAPKGPRFRNRFGKKGGLAENTRTNGNDVDVLAQLGTGNGGNGDSNNSENSNNDNNEENNVNKMNVSNGINNGVSAVKSNKDATVFFNDGKDDDKRTGGTKRDRSIGEDNEEDSIRAKVPALGAVVPASEIPQDVESAKVHQDPVAEEKEITDDINDSEEKSGVNDEDLEKSGSEMSDEDLEDGGNEMDKDLGKKADITSEKLCNEGNRTSDYWDDSGGGDSTDTVT